MKVCSTCIIVKSETEFYKKKTAKDGLQPKCKGCVKKYNNSYYTTHREQIVKRSKDWSIKNPEKVAEIQRKYHPKKDKQKVNARGQTNYAIKTGKLIKQPCPCGDKKVEAHHENYDEPLIVDWLCMKCHAKLHKCQNDRDPRCND